MRTDDEYNGVLSIVAKKFITEPFENAAVLSRGVPHCVA
jgi:hypothetical protein